MDGNLVGGIVGSVGGVLGGLVGTYFSLKNTNGPKERAFMIWAAVLCWLGISAFLTCLLLLPITWNWLVWIAYWPSLFWGVKKGNERQIRYRAEDTADRELLGGHAMG